MAVDAINWVLIRLIQLNLIYNDHDPNYHHVYQIHGTCVEISQDNTGISLIHNNCTFPRVNSRYLLNLALVYSSQSIILQSVGIGSEPSSHNVMTDTC
jgi:hypothetical protein